jgi:hypothetical protein
MLEKYLDDTYGFMRVRVTSKKISCKHFAVSGAGGVVTSVADDFTIDLNNHEVLTSTV